MLGATGIVTEEVTPLIGGLRARAGHLHLWLVISWITGGTWVAELLLYLLGRWRGEWLRRRWPAVRALVLRVFRVVRRHPWRSSLAVRWAWGLRLTLPIACGAARVPAWLYVIGSGISAFTWSVVFTFAGWEIGETALRLVGHLRKYESGLGIAIVVATIVLLIFLRRRHVEEEVVHVIDRDTNIPFLPHGHRHPPHDDRSRTAFDAELPPEAGPRSAVDGEGNGPNP